MSEETEIRYEAQYKEHGDTTWFVAGDMNGYKNRKDAEAAIEAQATKWRDNRHHKPVAAAQIVTHVTTSTPRPYLLIK